jgi:Fe-S-cluster containining protein
MTLLAELEAIYREADQAHAGSRCPGSTECCRFGITGREPYVTSIELFALRRAVAARGGPLAPKRRALPLARRNDDEGTCPLLTSEGRCAVYAWRPLGCRTFWCHRAEHDRPVRQPEINALVRKVKELSARHEPGGEHGRPLRRVLS